MIHASDADLEGRVKMDARELTKKFYELENTIYDYRKRIEYLEDSNRKLQMQVSDLKIDAEMNRRLKR